jgi:acetylornithine deacetylase/succinyl-diaminopimelate desuccinylase-like protein
LLALFAACTILLTSSASASAATRTRHQQLAFDIFKELVELNTVTSSGDTACGAEAMATRLRTAGLAGSDVQVLVSGPRKGKLDARLHGSGQHSPMLLLAHLDVVDARRADWLDPFQLTERDG